MTLQAVSTFSICSILMMGCMGAPDSTDADESAVGEYDIKGTRLITRCASHGKVTIMGTDQIDPSRPLRTALAQSIMADANFRTLAKRFDTEGFDIRSTLGRYRSDYVAAVGDTWGAKLQPAKVFSAEFMDQTVVSDDDIGIDFIAPENRVVFTLTFRGSGIGFTLNIASLACNK